MQTEQALNWLMQNSGSVIRYRTLTELLKEENEKKIKESGKELLSSSLVQFWLGNLKPDFGRNNMHGARIDTYENVMGKLYEFGLRKGMVVLDERVKPFRQWLSQQTRLPNVGYFPVFYRTLTAAFLAMAGYADDEAVKEWTLKRLETVYPFAKQGRLDNVYVSQNMYPSFPKAFKNAPLINPELYPDEEMKLPWIHDVNAFLHSPFIMENAQFRDKIETIVDFILSPTYQKLYPSYGIVRHAYGRYYAMGWSIHLPGYFESNVKPKDFGRFLLLMNLLGRSRNARKHQWFRRSVSLLESFKTEEGLVSFPREFLPEKKFGYWIVGGKMGLEANRRTRTAIVSESTFRYLEIRKIVQP